MSLQKVSRPPNVVRTFPVVRAHTPLSRYDERIKTMTRCLTLTCTILALTLLAGVARADVNDKVKSMRSPADSKEFAMKAAEGGMLEVKLAQLAQQKATSQDIKDLARKLEQDHSQANDQLKTVAKQKNIDLPNDLKGECEETYQAFQKLDGQDFDNAYLICMVKDHLKDIAMFQKEARSGTDQDIKQWASQTLPHLREHAGQIRTVAQACGLPMDALAGGNANDNVRPAGSRQGPSGTSAHDDHLAPKGGSSTGTNR
jgi:putative membrane protein